MTLFVKTINTVIDYTPTKEIAGLIYSYMEAGLDESMIFSIYGINIKTSIIVKKEFQRIESEVNLIMSDIENQPASQKELVALLSSELLDVALVVDDVRRYADGTPDDEPTRDIYKASFSIVLI